MSRVQLHTRRFMLAFVFLFFSASFVGCASGKFNDRIQGTDRMRVLQSLAKDGYNYSKYKTNTQWDLCRSFIFIGVYDGFFRCYDVLKKRVDANDGNRYFFMVPSS